MLLNSKTNWLPISCFQILLDPPIQSMIRVESLADVRTSNPQTGGFLVLTHNLLHMLILLLTACFAHESDGFDACSWRVLVEV